MHPAARSRARSGTSALCESRRTNPSASDHNFAAFTRAVVFAVTAWDVNGPQHIHRRFGERQLAPVVEKLQTWIDELEAENARPKANGPANM